MAIGLPSQIKRKEKLYKELDEIVEELKKFGAKKIILFGSLANGKVGQTSDIDLIAVKDTKERFMDRLNSFYENFTPSVAIDILCYTPEELEDMSKCNRFIKRALKQGKVLYEA